MINDYHVIEHQKATCREKIQFHTQNVILQSVISFLCVTGGIYGGQKRSITVPLVTAPIASVSVNLLVRHETKRRFYKNTLKQLQKE